MMEALRRPNMVQIYEAGRIRGHSAKSRKSIRVLIQGLGFKLQTTGNFKTRLGPLGHGEVSTTSPWSC